MNLGLRFLCVAAAVVGTACGTSGSAYNNDTANSPMGGTSVNFVAPGAPIFRGRLTIARHYPGLQIDLLPPPAHAVPAKTASDAYATCWTGAPCVPNASPEM